MSDVIRWETKFRNLNLSSTALYGSGFKFHTRMVGGYGIEQGLELRVVQKGSGHSKSEILPASAWNRQTMDVFDSVVWPIAQRLMEEIEIESQVFKKLEVM